MSTSIIMLIIITPAAAAAAAVCCGLLVHVMEIFVAVICSFSAWHCSFAISRVLVCINHMLAIHKSSSLGI